MNPIPPLAEILEQFNDHARFGELDTPRLRQRYCEWGDGRPLLFVHGMTDRMCSFAPIMYRLKDKFRCIGMELANGKDDGAPIGSYGIGQYVEDIYYLCNHLKLDEVVLFGSSFGSPQVLTALNDQPGRFIAGVLQGGFARRPLGFQERLLAKTAQFFPGRMAGLPGRMRVVSELDLPQMAGAEDGMWDFLIQNSGDTPCRTAALRGLIMAKLDLRKILPDIKQPVLLLGGDKDKTVPKQYELELLEGLPNAKRVEFAPCGHFAQYTHPQGCADAIRAFAAEHGLI